MDPEILKRDDAFTWLRHMCVCSSPLQEMAVGLLGTRCECSVELMLKCKR